jgi:tetratricopeptide (TPR) repeat protein
MKRNVVLLILCILLLTACASSWKPASTSNLVSLDEALAGAAADIGAKVQGKTEITIAGLEAPLSEVSDFITDELSTHLVSSGLFTVLPRSSALNVVNTEHEFQMSGLVSDASAVGIGHYLGAKVVVTGSLKRIAGFNQLRLRAIDVRTSALLSDYAARIFPNDAILASLMQPLDSIRPTVITENALVYLNRGEDLLRESRYEEAIKELDRALAINKDLAEGYFYRGTAYALLGDYELAIEDFDRAIKMELNKTSVYMNRGVAFAEKGDHDLAIVDFTAALRIRPDDPEALYNRGLAYAHQGNFEQAIADFTAALRIKPDFPEALYDRGIMYAQLGYYDRAIADWEAVLRINPNDPGAKQSIEIVRQLRGY